MYRECLKFIVLFLIPGWVFAGEMSQDLLDMSERWAILKYATEQNQRLDGLQELATELDQLVQEQPGNAVSMIWHAVVLSTLAQERGGAAGLGLAKQAKRLLEEAETINPLILDGLIYTILGSLYYQVPGYPVGFGNREKAEYYLLKALEISPNSLDANFYYGEYLLRNQKYQPAIEIFQRVLKMPIRGQNRLADTGLKREAEQALSKAKELLHAKDSDVGKNYDILR
jgi:tetratricopeptide (TPR) repeat protein